MGLKEGGNMTQSPKKRQKAKFRIGKQYYSVEDINSCRNPES